MTNNEVRPTASSFVIRHCASVLHVRVVTGAGGGPDKTILRSAKYADFPVAAAYLHPLGDSGIDTLRATAQQLGCSLHLIAERGPFDLRTIHELLGLCRKHNVTIWHAHDYKSDVLGLILKRLHPMKLVSTVHGFVTESRREKLYHRLDRLALLGYDHVIAVSPPLLEHCAAHGIHPDRLSHIPNAIDVNEYPHQPRSRNERPTIGVISRFSPEKGVDRAIRVLADLPECELHLVGDGPQRATLEQLARIAGVADRVVWHGWQSDPRRFYRGFDVLLLPSRTEGLPNVVLEAMALRIPVAAAAVGGVPDVLDQGRCGVLLNGDELDWPDAIRKTIGAGASLTDRARRRVEEHFGFDRRMKRIAAIYADVLSRDAH